MTWVLVIVMVVATVLSDLLQSFEMKRAGEQTVGARGRRPFATDDWRTQIFAALDCVPGVLVLCLHGARAIAPLSFAVPASASSFVLETVLAKVLLKEHIGARRAAGTLLVLCGVVLLGK
ncbi:MAG: hypothetical protein WDO73_06490 [Ignavibacteriota bacterium]